MKRALIALVLLICLVAIVASVLDVRCIAMQPAADTLILACRAGRLTRIASHP
jgi:hypothetical protein